MEGNSSRSLLFNFVILLSCTTLLIQIGYAYQLPSNQKITLPNPQECVQSFTNAGVCLLDIWTNFGRPSAACCEALNKINNACWSGLMPFLNPSFAPFFRGLCSVGGGNGGLPFPPVLPFPFPFPSLNPPPSVDGGDAGVVAPPKAYAYQLPSNQKITLPNPQECVQSFTNAGVCLLDIWTNFGRPSAACCEALNKINNACWSGLMPFLNPSFAPFLRGLCPVSGGSGGLPFPPVLPFPFPFPSLNPPPSVGGGDTGVAAPPNA